MTVAVFNSAGLSHFADSRAMELRLPFPPSTNNLHINVQRKGRVSSPEYLDWQDDAGWELNAQLKVLPRKTMEARCIITIDLDDRRNGDCANREKAIVDLLVTHGVIADDSKKYVQRVSIGWEKLEGCRVRLEEAPCR